MSTPLWRQMYNAWEKAVSPGLEEVTASNGFRDVLALAMKTNADIGREIERSSRQVLHLLNLPAATDVRRLRQQVTSLERELLALRHELERQGAAEPAPASKRAGTTSAKDGKGTKGKGGTSSPTPAKTKASKGTSGSGTSGKGKASKGTTATASTTRPAAGAIELTTVTSTNGTGGGTGRTATT